MRNIIVSLAILGLSSAASAQVTIYWDSYFSGYSLEFSESVANLEDYGFGDETSSVKVDRGYAASFYRHDNYRGDRVRCVGPANIAYLHTSTWKLGDEISSIWIVEEDGTPGCSYWSPPPPPVERDPSPKW